MDAAPAFMANAQAVNATAGWKPRDSNVRVAASKLREERSGQPPRCRIAGEVG